MPQYIQIIKIPFIAKGEDEAKGMAADTIYVLKTNEIEAEELILLSKDTKNTSVKLTIETSMTILNG